MIKIERDGHSIDIRLNPNIETEDNKTTFRFGHSFQNQAQAEIICQHFNRELEGWKKHLIQEALQDLQKDIPAFMDVHGVDSFTLQRVKRELLKASFTKNNWSGIYYEKK